MFSQRSPPRQRPAPGQEGEIRTGHDALPVAQNTAWQASAFLKRRGVQAGKCICLRRLLSKIPAGANRRSTLTCRATLPAV